MKIIKLDRRYVLGKEGFVHALRFRRRDEKSAAIANALESMHGTGWLWYRPWNDESNYAWGSYRDPRRDRPTYYIGVKNESDLVAAILMAKINHE
jgi:hypothetical protein